MALRLGITSGSKVLDVGCGVGGPLRNIARFTGAQIIGLNNNLYQVQRGNKHVAREGLQGRCNLMHGSFMDIKFPADTFDFIYAIDSVTPLHPPRARASPLTPRQTCHSSDKVATFKQIHRVLKPGGKFALYEWVTTPKFNPKDAYHKQVIEWINIGNGLPFTMKTTDVNDALKKAGFSVLDTVDVAAPQFCDATWFAPLEASWTLSGFRHSRIGSAVTHLFVTALETLGLAPKGTTETHRVLRLAQKGLVEGGRLGIFTPCYFVVCQK